MPESSSEDQFRILQREIRESIRRNHPNPNRINCVGTEKLSKIAKGELPPDDPAYSHIMECSPCYEEVMTLTEQQAQSEHSRAARKRTPMVIAAVAAIVIIGIAVAWLLHLPGEPAGERSPQPTITENKISPPPETKLPSAGDLPVAVLNLESESATRGTEGKQTSRGLQRLARKRMNLMIYLPLGMEEGRYEVTLSRGNAPVLLQLSGEARIEDGLAVLRVQADLSSLPPGTYRLRFRRQGESWHESRVSLY